MGKRIRKWLAGRLPTVQLRRVGIILLFLPSLVSFAILVGAAVYLITWPDDGTVWFSSTGRIERVDLAGPAGRLLRPGDKILSLDGVRLEQIVQLYAGKRPGDGVTFAISRDGEEHHVAITLAAPPLSRVVSRLEPLFVALAFWAIGIVVLAFKPADRTAYLFFCFNQLGCVALCLGTLSAIGLLLAHELFSPSLWFLGSLTIHLHLRFPRPIMIWHRRLLVLAVYGLAVDASLLGMFEKLAWAMPALAFPFPHVTERFYLAASFLLSVALLSYSYHHATSFQVRRQIRLVILGAALALIPLSFLLLLPEALLGLPLVPYELTVLFLLAIPLGYGYSIIRYQLIQLDRTVSRGLVYILLALLLTTSYLLLSAGFSNFFPETLAQDPWAITLFIFVMALFFIPLRNRLQLLIDWVFYGGWYNYQTAVQKFSRALDGVIDAPSLATRLLSELRATLKLECACFFLRDVDGNLSTQGVGPICPLFRSGPLQLAGSGALSEWFEREQRPLAASALPAKLTDLSTAEQALLTCTQGRLWVSLAERGKLLGLLLLGRKLGDDPFDGEDLRILEVVRRQASITLQNIALLCDLSKRAAQMEQLHQQLLRTREQERKRLARELHDDIIQSLVGLNYDLSRIQIQQAGSSDGDVERLQQQVQGVMRDLRKVCSELRPPTLDSLGLVSAVRARLRDFENEGELRARLVVEGNEDIIVCEEASVCLYRVLQEALVNIQKHAGAT